MIKTIKIATIASILTAPAFSANLENPLYIPQTGNTYTKTSAGVMYKITDHTTSLKNQNLDGKEEVPIWRFNETAGYGISDKLSLNLKLGYTNDEDIQRQGLHKGRIGLLYRIFDKNQSPVVWDVYADLHLGGLSKMKSTLIPVSGGTSLGFDYANYSNGRWGFFAGTRIGKTWDKFTASAFGEIHQTFSNHNSQITISDSARNLISQMVTVSTGSSALGAAYAAGLPDDFKVKLKSTTEYNSGINAFYQINDDWSVGSEFTARHRASNTIQEIILNNSADLYTLSGGATSTQAVTDGIAAAFMGTLDDGIDEYCLSAAVSHKMTDSVQVSLYGEYTFDDADSGYQNGSDIRAEIGARINMAF